MTRNNGKVWAGKTLAAAAAGMVLSAMVVLTGPTAAWADSPWDRSGPHAGTGAGAQVTTDHNGGSHDDDSPWD